MKLFKYISLLVPAVVVMLLGLSGCAKADPDFVHPTNTISQMLCMASHDGTEYVGTIYEYTKDGQLLDPGFTQSEADGGYGIITFVIPASDKDNIDLTSVFLKATVTYDEFIYPSLTGRHNILATAENPEGLVIAVKSGTNTVRKYRIVGTYEN